MFPLRLIFPSPRRLLTSINILRFVWILLFFILEHQSYKHAVNSCSWAPSTETQCRLVLIADPQIVDENTYSRRGITMWLTKVFTDRYMRRNWKFILAQKPGTIIFLGDLMDGGREWDDE